MLTCVSRVLFCRLRLYHGSPRALLHPLLQDPIERKRRGLARPAPAVLSSICSSYDFPEC